MGDLSYFRKVLLDDCRWLFGQDVQIVTYSVYEAGKVDKYVYHALVLPKAYSLRSLSHGDTNEKILFHVQEKGRHESSDAGIKTLFDTIKERISEILKFDSNARLYHIDKSKLPAEAFNVPVISDQTQISVIEGEDKSLVQDVQSVDSLELECRGGVSQAQHDTISRLPSVSTKDLTQPPPNTEPDSGGPQGSHQYVRVGTPMRESKRKKTAKEPTGGTPMEKTDSRQGVKSNQPIIAITDVKPLPVSENRWKPRRTGTSKKPRRTGAPKKPQANPTLSEDVRLSPELVQRKVRAALNKMVPETLDKITNQILEIIGQSKFETDGRTLRQVIQLTFERAIDEAARCPMYAKLCKLMLESMDPNIKDENICDKNGLVVTGGNLFRKYLLNRCQEGFEGGWKFNLPPKPEGISDEAVILSDEYYIARRRGLGLVQFIGELYKLGMLTERIMNECIRKFLKFKGLPEDETVESLCKLLKTVGFQLDASEKSKGMMDMHFVRISRMVEDKELNSRMRFMLMDIIDLRRKKWEIKEADKGPKTIQEVRDDAIKAQQEEAASRANSQRSRPGGGGRSYSNYDNKMPGWQDQFSVLSQADVDSQQRNAIIEVLENDPYGTETSTSATDTTPSIS